MKTYYICEGQKYTNTHDLRKVFNNISLPQILTVEVLEKLGVEIIEIKDETIEHAAPLPSIADRLSAVEDTLVDLMLRGSENV